MGIILNHNLVKDITPNCKNLFGVALISSTLPTLLMALTPLLASTQEISGPLIAPGHIRIDISTSYLHSDTRFGKRNDRYGSLIKEEEPLGFDFSDASVGTRIFPGLEALEQNIKKAAGVEVEPFILGSSKAVITQSAVWLPIRVDIGIFSWLSVGGMVPFSQRRAEVASTFNPSGANAGITPSASDPIRVDNFLGELLAAEASLKNISKNLCSSNPSSFNCIESSALLAESQEFQNAIVGAFTSHGVFPLEGTVTGNALQYRVQTLMAAHQGLGVPFPSNIPLATELLNEDKYGNLITNPGYGVTGAPFSSWRSLWEMGDIELYANFRLWGSEQNDGEYRPHSDINYQIGAGSLIRLGTGKVDLPENFIDKGSGDGQNDLEVNLFGGLNVNRLGIWGEIRYGFAYSTLVPRRISSPDEAFPSLQTTQIVRWKPGNYLQLRLTPRFQLTDVMSVALDLTAFSKNMDSYESISTNSSSDVSLLELETGQDLLDIGIGVVYSTLQNGKGRPTEARLLFRRSVSGGGGLTPKMDRIEFGLRLFKKIWN